MDIFIQNISEVCMNFITHFHNLKQIKVIPSFNNSNYKIAYVIYVTF